MPKCIKCSQMLPPDLCEDIPGTSDQTCLFCKNSRDFISLDGQLIKKGDAIEDYKQFLNKMADLSKKSSFKDLMIKNALRKEGLIQ